MRASKALLMRRASESLRSLEGSDRVSDDEDDGSEAEKSVDLPPPPQASVGTSAAVAGDGLEKLIPGKLIDLGGKPGCAAVGVWAEKEWMLQASHHRVQLDVVDEASKTFETYQWIGGESELDTPMCCAFCPPLIPLQPPSSLHECRSLESTGTFAIAWSRQDTPNQCYVRVYDPVEGPVTTLQQDWKWISDDEFNCTVGRINTIAFSPGAAHVIVGGDLGLQLWNLSLREEIWSVIGEETCPGGIHQVQFSPEGRLIASVAPRSRMVRLWWRSESAGNGGFAFLLLPHGDPVKKIEWRPRSASSIYGSAQTLLTQCESGRVRVWQESDPLEDFDFYVVCEINACSPSAFVSWVHYFADYNGLMWPPPSSFRKRKTAISPAPTEEPKKLRTYSSRRVWGAMERGHGHSWFGEAAYDNLESRLGGFPPQSNARDWIVSHDSSKLSVWSVEGLGEHARSAVRCEVWAERAVALPDYIQRGLAYCRFLVPASYEGRTMPRCDELFADNPPTALRICGQAAVGASRALVAFRLGRDSATIDALVEFDQELKDGERVNMPSFDYDFVFTQVHQANHIRFLSANPATKELLTVDHSHRLIVWDGELLTARRAFDLNMRVKMGMFCPSKSTRWLLTLEDSTDRVIAHTMSGSEEISGDSSHEAAEHGEVIGVCELNGTVFIIREAAVLRVANKDGRQVAMRLKVKATTMAYSADFSSVLIGTVDGSLVQFTGMPQNQEHLGPPALVLSSSSSSTASTATQTGWYVKKICCAGMWVALLQGAYGPSSKPIVFVASVASNLLDDLEEENAQFRISGLNEDQRGSGWEVVDVSLCDFGGSVCGLAILLSDGSIRVASRKGAQWQVVASTVSGGLPTLHGPIGLTWLNRGKIAVFDRSGVVQLVPGWTASLPLAWNFGSGLTPGWVAEDRTTKRAQLLKRQSMKRTMSDSTSEEGVSNFVEAVGNVTHICAASQLSLPDHHPVSLLENFRQGRLDRVEAVLKHMYKTISVHLLLDRPVQIPPSPPDEEPPPSATEPSPAPPSSATKSAASLLFSSPPQLGLSTTEQQQSGNKQSGGLSADWLSQLETKLPTTRIVNVSPTEHLTLLSCVSLFRRLSDEKVSGLDAAGSKFALAVETLKIQNRGTVGNESLRTSEVIWAMHSDAQSVLMKNFLEQPNTVWPDCRALGAGFWVQNPADGKSLMERLAKTHFMQYNKDPFRSLLFYSALNKPRVASALFKTVKNDKVAMLLAQDFSQERWRTAAVKNGYALVEKRRYEEAAGFFLLGGKTSEALRVLSKNQEDFQLALFVGKVVVAMAQPGTPASDDALQCFQTFLKESYMEIALAVKDPWLCSMIFTLLGDPQTAVRTFAPDFFTKAESALDAQDPSGKQKRLERYVWLREVAARDKPKCSGFDPVVQMFLKHVLSRAPFFFSTSASNPLVKQGDDNEFNALIRANRRRSALFYLSQGLPKLALDFISEEEESCDEDHTLRELKMQACVSASLPTVLQSDECPACSDVDSSILEERTIACCREMNFDRAYLNRVALDLDRIDFFVDNTVAKAFRDITYGGCSAAEVSARRLAGYALILNANVDRCIMEPEKQLASMAAFAGVVLSALMLRQYSLLDSFFSAGPFELARPARFAVISGAARMSRDFLDYEESSPPSSMGQLATKSAVKEGDWAQSFARGVLKLLIFEHLLDVFSQSGAAAEIKQSALVFAIFNLITRLKSDLHVGVAVPENATFAVVVDPLRPYMATSRSFEDFNEQALWTRFNGPERILKLVGEIAHSVRYRNRRPFVASQVATTPSSSGLAAPPEVASMRKGPLTAITLYQNPGENLSGVVISNAFPNHMVVASLDRGTREINIKSSLKFRNRTPDGRGLTDSERATWAEVIKRFAEEEKADSDEGWELFLSASATGMRHRYLNSVALNTSTSASITAALGGPTGQSSSPMPQSTQQGNTVLMFNRSEKANRAGSFLSFGNNRLSLSLKHQIRHKQPQDSVSSMPSRDDPVTRIAAHPFLPTVVAGYIDGSATLWHLGEARGVCRFQRPANFLTKSPITRLRVSPDGFKVLGGDAFGRCSIWQIDLGESQPFVSLTCAGSNRAIMDCAFLNLSSVFATCSLEGIVSLYDTLLPPRSSCVASWYNPAPPVTGIPVGPIPNGLCSLAFSPQTRRLITGTERGSIYSIDVRQCKTAVEARHVHNKAIMTLAISQDGYILGSGSADGSVKLWSLDDLGPVATIPNLHPPSSSATSSYHQAVSEIAFAPNGSLFSCGADGTVKISYSSEAVI